MNSFIAEPKVKFHLDEEKNLQFTLSNVNVSIANAIRRTILSDIPMVVFKTTPYEENKSNFITNTSRLNNEILKQRLSCIPIHIENIEIDNLDDYIVEINVSNDTESVIYVTTNDFKVINIKENKEMDERSRKIIFPPWVSSEGMEHYIEFARLRPRISETIPGEKLHLTCSFSYATAKENSMYNCVSVSSYGMTPDTSKQQEYLRQLKQEEKDETKHKMLEKNWLLLEGQRVVTENSFDFIIQTIGVYSNKVIVNKACLVIIQKLENVIREIEINMDIIKVSENTLANSYDIILENEDYTIGKVIEYILYSRLFEGENKMLNFCGFKKQHPHQDFSVVRIAFIDSIEKEQIKEIIIDNIKESIKIFQIIYKKFI